MNSGWPLRITTIIVTEVSAPTTGSRNWKGVVVTLELSVGGGVTSMGAGSGSGVLVRVGRWRRLTGSLAPVGVLSLIPLAPCIPG